MPRVRPGPCRDLGQSRGGVHEGLQEPRGELGEAPLRTQGEWELRGRLGVIEDDV